MSICRSNCVGGWWEVCSKDTTHEEWRGDIAHRSNDQMTRWPDDQITGWSDNRMIRWPDDQMTGPHWVPSGSSQKKKWLKSRSCPNSPTWFIWRSEFQFQKVIPKSRAPYLIERLANSQRSPAFLWPTNVCVSCAQGLSPPSFEPAKNKLSVRLRKCALLTSHWSRECWRRRTAWGSRCSREGRRLAPSTARKEAKAARTASKLARPSAESSRLRLNMSGVSRLEEPQAFIIWS